MADDAPLRDAGADELVPFLDVFIGGFWTGLEPMFLLTFLIAALGALGFM
jgi:hypothetical protein